jgi:hypothetical protein
VHGRDFSAAISLPYVTGALIATCFCWAGVIFYFLGRYGMSFWVAVASVILLLVYKFVVIG